MFISACRQFGFLTYKIHCDGPQVGDLLVQLRYHYGALLRPKSKLSGTKGACRVEFVSIKVRVLADKCLKCQHKRPKIVGK